ncbi:DUF924 family protein [Nodosilinea sp. P-1105]|uniref:DUF924 family protein n=1 Tax=Nodosilinea sp. P-1105 TaxID=2546229 RepID=UPI00146A0D6C|nr:DUF924 family protein [Nodosilinea sp. P-1105]NMF85069.1 DUF924 domain-containing protein [Nodosilinea sp. P-1105]
MDRVTDILNFWFDDPHRPSSEYGQQRQIWFKKDPTFDATIRQRFLVDYQQAAAGQLAPWQAQPRSCLALLLLLDQFPRNLFRGDPRSFATDDQALAIAHQAINQGFDQALVPVERLFIYLPLEHSESLADQNQCVALIEALHQHSPQFEAPLDYAYRHQQVIQRFGRFPHRNQVLGRTTTPEEAAFLKQPGSGF